MERKKILVFAQSTVGGAERMSVTVTKTLDRDNFEVVYYLVGSSDNNGKESLKEFIPADLEVRCLRGRNPMYLIAMFFWILLKEHPNVVFSSVININNKLLLLRNLFKKTRFIVRCDNYLYTYNERQRRIIDMTYHRADIIIAQTEEMKDELVNEMHVTEGKVVVLQNPVDTETIDRKIKGGDNPYLQNGKTRYVACGRFAIQKGFDLLVDAFAKVKELQTNAELYIVGKNDTICEEYYSEVAKHIERYGLQDCVRCVGFQSNPYVYIKYADCFVLSSRFEGLPNVMLESIYLGTPVSAFKCIPVIERIVKEGVNGYLAEKENIDALAKAMVEASRLGRVKSVYRSADIETFHHLLEFDS